jgi:hypothetical protein
VVSTVSNGEVNRMFNSKTDTAQADRRPVMRDYTVLALGMSAAIITTLAVIGGTLGSL